MVTGCHNLSKERFSATRIGIENFQTLRKHILITYAPDVREGYFMAVYLLTINNFIAIMREEIAHIIEITVAPVEVLYHVTMLF